MKDDGSGPILVVSVRLFEIFRDPSEVVTAARPIPPSSSVPIHRSIHPSFSDFPPLIHFTTSFSLPTPLRSALYPPSRSVLEFLVAFAELPTCHPREVMASPFSQSKRVQATICRTLFGDRSHSDSPRLLHHYLHQTHESAKFVD